jgi:hypothetical protein
MPEPVIQLQVQFLFAVAAPLFAIIAAIAAIFGKSSNPRSLLHWRIWLVLALSSVFIALWPWW